VEILLDVCCCICVYTSVYIHHQSIYGERWPSSLKDLNQGRHLLSLFFLGHGRETKLPCVSRRQTTRWPAVSLSCATLQNSCINSQLIRYSVISLYLSLSLSLSLYTYIYIYIYVCVCVCVRIPRVVADCCLLDLTKHTFKTTTRTVMTRLLLKVTADFLLVAIVQSFVLVFRYAMQATDLLALYTWTQVFRVTSMATRPHALHTPITAFTDKSVCSLCN